MLRVREISAVWAMFGVVLVAIVVTYTRLAPEELYRVDGHGFVGGGLSRAVVYVNFPIGLAAMLLLLGLADGMSRAQRTLAVVAFLLWTPVFSSRVLSESYLDARWGNVTPAVAVAIAVLLTLRTPAPQAERVRGDAVRIGLGAALVVLALPWIAALLGVDFVGVPVLGQIFQTHEFRSQPGDPTLHPAVHYGDHHGLELTLVLIAALVASRWLGAIRSPSLHTAFGLATGVVIVYSLMNIANDGWLEQVVKRGWTNWEIPGVLVPRANWGWAVILIGGLVTWLTVFRPRFLENPVPSVEKTEGGLTAAAEPESVRVWNCGRPGKQPKDT
jgi:hypothetical protein